VVHRFHREGREFLLVYFEWFAVNVPRAVVRPVVTASGSVLAADFCDGMSTTPNNGAAPNRRLPLGYVPWSLSGFLSQGSAVGGR